MSARIEFISAGFREILLSDGVKELVQSTADEIRDKANTNYDGDGFESSVKVGGYGGGRWIGYVGATDKKSTAAESENQALTRAVT